MTHHAIACAVLVAACTSASTPSDPDAAPAVTSPAIWLTPSATIDPTKLPLRDQHFVADAPSPGEVFVCDPRMYRQTNGPGATLVGPWVDAADLTYDVTRKVLVQGDVKYPNAKLDIATSGDQRTITGNGLPVGPQTGVFPVSPDDPAYTYGQNPNPVTEQQISFAIPSEPTIAATPSCVYKEVGITLDGIQIHNPLDSTGRDELAYEVQDVCTGAPQPNGGYHRHALGECTPHIHDRVALVGYALDGFGIYSPYDADGNELTSAALDECHGTTSVVPWDGAMVAMYHYVLTRDFPYSIACFRGTPTRNAFPPLGAGAPPQT